jgi:hypothetical protein
VNKIVEIGIKRRVVIDNQRTVISDLHIFSWGAAEREESRHVSASGLLEKKKRNQKLKINKSNISTKIKITSQEKKKCLLS